MVGPIVFSSGRLCVCLFVCLSVNTIGLTPEPLLRPIIAKFSGRYPTVERAEKFENGYTGQGVQLYP